VSAHAEAEQEDDRCPVCDRLWTEEDQATWLFLEVTRYTSDGRPGWDSESFCSQSHAAQWLAAPLPPFDPVTEYHGTARDRLAELGFLALFAVLVAVMCVGFFAISDWLGLYR
jgi:hypothetical protein